MTYAVDFDGTMCENVWPSIGNAKWNVLQYCRELRRDGHKLILNTCRENELLSAAVWWCLARGLAFDAVNENLPEHIATYGSDCRKIFADYYIDDKNLFLEGVNNV